MLSALTVVVAVLTVLFNLVGTLCVSVITGMMAGASRRLNWQVITLSLVPPGVALVLGYITKVDFGAQRGLSLLGICLASFWGIWVATYLLMLLERRSEPAPGRRASTRSTARQELNSSRQRENNSPGARLSSAVSKAGKVEYHLGLDDLQGTWICESVRPDEPSTKKVLVVKQRRFSFGMVNASGDTRIVALGEVTEQEVNGQRELVISRSHEEAAKGL